MEVSTERKMAQPRAVSAKAAAGATGTHRLGYTNECRKRRAANWLTLGTTYAIMYVGRYNLSMANASLSQTYGWNKTQIGAIISTALLLYGLSAMFNGPIGDKIGGRKSMLIGACGAMVAN